MLFENQQPLIFFDGVCNLCNGVVQFIIKRDSRAVFHFAALQSESGQELLRRIQLPPDHFDSFFLLDKGQLYSLSTAALRLCRQLDGGWKLLYILIIIPPFIRDNIYRWIAKNRYRWFGKRDNCMMPTPALKQRFL